MSTTTMTGTNRIESDLIGIVTLDHSVFCAWLRSDSSCTVASTMYSLALTHVCTHTHTHTPGLTVYPSRFRSDSQAKRSLAASILKLLSRSSSHRWCWPVRVEESWSPSLSMPFLSHSLRMPTRSLSWLPTSFTITFRSSERSLPCRRG